MDAIARIDQPAPDFTLTSLEGDPYHLYSHLGELIILNFWSAECPWSERGDQEILEALSAWGGKVALWTISANVNEPLEMITSVSRQRSLPVLLLDPGHKIADLYGAQTTPHVFVIDATSRLRYQGAINDITFRHRIATRHYLKEVVTALLAGGKPNPSSTSAYGCTIVRDSP